MAWGEDYAASLFSFLRRVSRGGFAVREKSIKNGYAFFARLFYFSEGAAYKERMEKMKKVGIVMGSGSDLPVVRKAAEVCASFGVPFELRVLSAHRSPAETAAFARAAREDGFGVLIGAAGMAAHLAGALAANTPLPVIALPLKSKALDGADALLASVMMPPGVPVASVGIDCAANAGYLAVQILAVGDAALAEKYDAFREDQHRKNLAADESAQSAAEEIRNGI